MRKTLLLMVAFGATVLLTGGVGRVGDLVLAQSSDTSRGASQSPRQPGGGVGARPGEPTSAQPNAATPRAGSGATSGPPAAGGETSSEGLGTINRTPSGAIRPGTNMPGGQGGSN